MTDPILERFARACRARQPLGLRVDSTDGSKLAEGQVEPPFVLVGRDDACDVTLTDPEVDPRHLWLQVLDGQVYAVDLGSRIGLRWPEGIRGSGWLQKDRPLQVGPFILRLQTPPAGSDDAPTLPSTYQPLQSDPALLRRFPCTVLEFRNGKRARDRWQVNRRLTLIGRAPECKIRLSADDIASYHCGLVFTPDGLWVVDLSGRGIVANGERMRVAPLDDGADLWVGRFRIGVHVGPRAASLIPPPGGATSTTPPSGETTAPSSSSAISEPQPGTPAVPPPSLSDDEVPLGVLTPHSSESAAGLSSSHIMAETFAPQSGSDISQSIFIAQSGSLTPPPMARPADFDLSQVEPYVAATTAEAAAVAPETREEHRLLPLLREMAELHYRMAGWLQQSCELLLQLSVQLHPDKQAELQTSLATLQQIGDLLRGLQTSLSRFSSETPREIRHPPPRPRPAPPPSTNPHPPNASHDEPPLEQTAEETALHTHLHVRFEPRSRSRHNKPR